MGDMLVFEGGDLIVGTPILDIQPYSHCLSDLFPVYPEWVTAKLNKSIKVVISLAAQMHLSLMDTSCERLTQLIIDSLKLDPRSRRARTELGMFANYINDRIIAYKFVSMTEVILLGVWTDTDFRSLLKLDPANPKILKLRSAAIHEKLLNLYGSVIGLDIS
eukprot:Blabericola_migrator_1__13356@NODE_946_length_5929_cov_20_975776_g644_i1_p2_GENE_NODE_946_length_5929_cov_20_975776_g644_i1NODE_946_length_5929_cov_20_975776_g644_i1_p2_ORF_typecomplete_len162_score26_46TrmO/PF01980_16/0_0014TrmO/PF01980_16/4_5e02TrmO_C/PF18389_1/0_0095TPR_14/PF13428_6/3_2TPR_14/PF13428_6/25PhageA118_gp45/PF10653_9/0_21_NODE_946_length_5929_cov_20_975776_g644_i1153638